MAETNGTEKKSRLSTDSTGSHTSDAPPNSNHRLSIDSDANLADTAAKLSVNGTKNIENGGDTSREDSDLSEMSAEQLRAELEKTREEKDALETQFQNLVNRLSAMKTTLGTKLKEDAEELDRRENIIRTLQADIESYQSTTQTLQHELALASQESAKLTSELHSLRNRSVDDSARTRELEEDVERLKLERLEWEEIIQQERVGWEELGREVMVQKREVEGGREERDTLRAELEKEKEKTKNLQSVLEEFQAVKEVEMKQSLQHLEGQVEALTTSLAEYKSRALTAEAELSEAGSHNRRVEELEKELREKNILIGRVRHESVIANEHLTEALRRLRKSSSSDNVDRRLVTNVLLQFLTTSRADSKRFEMLSLLATVLGWSDTEREKAGLQKPGSSSGANGAGLGRRVSGASLGISGGKPSSPNSDRAEEVTESFSKMWVEFLLKEAAQGTSPSSTTAPTGVPSPARSTFSLPASPGPHATSFSGPPRSPFLAGLGLPSIVGGSNHPASRSSLNLTLPPQPHNEG
ncbi:hypothetical protein FRC03_005748 [Tulasnella sp. 419]|nr:hypothetical protein FRC03_005748 [Tulasnella sp. 419]